MGGHQFQEFGIYHNFVEVPFWIINDECKYGAGINSKSVGFRKNVT